MFFRAPIAELLKRAGSKAWLSLVGGETLLRREDVHDRRKGLDPYIRLALDIQKLDLDAWLDQGFDSGTLCHMAGSLPMPMPPQ